jgi:uncharacterized protein YbjT (DUF2867 family)
MKTALILGSTGLVGTSVVEQLINDTRYSKIILINRRSTNPENPKVEEIVIDFNALPSKLNDLAVDDVFCCIGTTIKTAGSKEKFKAVDFEIPFQFGQLALKNKWSNFATISSLGANSKSSTFYSQVKGEMEEALIGFGLDHLVIVRPSLLLGDRNEFRLGERIAQAAFLVLNLVMIGPLKKFRAISADQVAKSMIYFLNENSTKIIHENDELLGV